MWGYASWEDDQWLSIGVVRVANRSGQVGDIGTLRSDFLSSVFSGMRVPGRGKLLSGRVTCFSIFISQGTVSALLACS